MTLTIGLIALLSFLFFNYELNLALFYGFMVVLSSNAIVVKLLMYRAEINTLHGLSSVGILYSYFRTCV